MADNALVQVRIDPEIREKASQVLARSGLTVSDAARILLTRIANDEALPYGLVSEDPEYDAWFRAKVQEALDDPRPAIDGEDVEREFAERREALRARLKAAE
jgi:DNA-damage-inducible protein J